MKHTEGPWHVTNDAETNIRAGKRLVARVFDVWERGPDPDINQRVAGACEANARLIAAAPALLEALRDLADLTSNWYETREMPDAECELVPALRAAERAIRTATEGADG